MPKMYMAELYTAIEAARTVMNSAYAHAAILGEEAKKAGWGSDECNAANEAYRVAENTRMVLRDLERLQERG